MKDLHVRIPDELYRWLSEESTNRGLAINVYLAHLIAEKARGEASTKPLTASQLADAFGCFWNAAIGESHRQQGGITTATIMAEGIQAIANRLREISDAGS